MTLSAPRGTVDILPESSYKWHFIESQARRIAELFGFSEIRTPIFEHAELFMSGIGAGTDIVKKEMYIFKDKKERLLALRPEGTATVMRSVLEHKLFVKPINKLFYMGPYFRYERPQAGRYRQFHQFGLETLGSDSPATDAEIMHAVIMLFNAVGLKNLSLSINSLGCKECRPAYREELIKYLSSQTEHLCIDCNERIEINPMRVLDCKREECRAIISEAPKMPQYLCSKCRDHFAQLQSILDAFRLPYQHNPDIVRGLDYYTGTVFEVLSKSLGAQDAVCGGGRYDLLSEKLGGKQFPAVGAAVGLERLLGLLEKNNVPFPERTPIKLYIISTSSEAEQMVSRILAECREHGIATERDYTARSLKSQMKTAAEINAPYVMIVGSNEFAAGEVSIKRMADGVQTSMAPNSVVKYLLNEEKQ